MKLRAWQEDLRQLLRQSDCPPVVVVELPEGAGKTTGAEELFDYFFDRVPAGFFRTDPDPTDVERIVGNFLLTFIDNVTVENGQAIARAALGVVARPGFGPRPTVVFFGEDCSQVTKVIGEVPGLRSAYIRDFGRELELLRSRRLALPGWRIPYIVCENGTELHRCAHPDCRGYPWKASEHRHPCGGESQ